MCHQIIFKARHPGTLWGRGEERIDAVSGVAPTNVDMRTHLVHVCKCTCASHSLPCDLHESQRVAFPPSRSSSQTSWCIRNTRRAGHNAGPSPQGDAFWAAAARNWVPHFGRHSVTDAVPCPTREGLDLSLGSCTASLHRMASPKNSTGEDLSEN